MNITILNVNVGDNRTDSLLEYLEHEGYKYVTETVLHKADIMRCKELLELELIKKQKQHDKKEGGIKELSYSEIGDAKEFLYRRGMITRSVNDAQDWRVDSNADNVIKAMEDYALLFLDNVTMVEVIDKAEGLTLAGTKATK